MKEFYKNIERYIADFSVGPVGDPLEGRFSLLRNQCDWDLYGALDLVYVLFTIGWLDVRTDPASRRKWAERILHCQDERGWFSKRNLRGHSKEHATAYALGGLHLLSSCGSENYLEKLKPMLFLKPLLHSPMALEKWISSQRLWFNVWPGSHIAGGIPAILTMADQFISGEWKLNSFPISEWFSVYFDWLNKRVNPKTGYWQLALWNYFFKKPIIRDMGGAVHLFWIYSSRGEPLPFPSKIINNTLSFQKSTGLYKKHPFCIDLDANFCIIRAYEQLVQDEKESYRSKVSGSVEHNVDAIWKALSSADWGTIYPNSHGLPGALAALTESKRILKIDPRFQNWCHVLDRVCWL